MLALLLLACTVSPDAPATPGSPAAAGLERVQAIDADAQEIRRLAHELTSLVDESRRQVADGRSTQAAEIAKMRDLMRRIEERNEALQRRARELDAWAHEQAGDPAWPPEPLPK